MLAVTGPMSTHAQTGQRLYLRFNELTNNTPVDYRGMRIKRNESDDHYWVLGKSMTGQNSSAVAYIDPLDPTNSLGANTFHTHYFAQQSPYIADIAYASDFDLNDANTLAGAGTIEISAQRYIPSPPSGQALSLFAVNSTPNLPLVPTGSFDYHMITRVEVPVPCSPIKYDASAPFGPSYAVAWNLIDPATVGAGNLRDWGIASISAVTMGVNWSQVWTGAAANQWEDVRDLVLKPIGVGYYACCGMRKDLTTGIQSGLLTSVNRVTGALAYQRYCTPPVGFALEFNSLTVIPNPVCSDYIVVGTLTSTATPPAAKRIYIASLTCAGAVNWSWALGLSNYDDAEGYRHIMMPDGGFIIAGKITHKNGAPTSGLLVKVANKTIDASVGCEQGNTPLIQWWNEYDTYDPLQGGSSGVPNVNVELIDVCPILDGSPNNVDKNNDVAAVGTAEMTHSTPGTLIKDILWLETTTIAGIHGYSKDNGAVNGAECISASVDRFCDEIALTVTELTPSPRENFQTDATLMSDQPDDPFRFCDAQGSDFTTKQGLDKRADEDIKEVFIATDKFETTLSVAPIPSYDASTYVSFSLEQLQSVDVSLFDMSGIKIRELASGFCKAGSHTFHIDCSHLNSGMYLLRLRTNQGIKTTLLPLVH